MSEVKSIKDYEKQNYEGIDTSLDISLFEYGVIWGINEYCDQEMQEYHFVYGVDIGSTECGDSEYNHFDHGYMTKNDFIDMLDSWVDLESLCNTCDTTRDILINGWPSTIYEVFNYYGYENVFGSSYWEGFKINNE